MEKTPKKTKGQEKMDPRRKDSVGLDYWAASMLRRNIITKSEYDEFISKNNSKEEEMEKLMLTQLKHYGFFNSIEEMQDKLHHRDGDRFVIRCASKSGQDVKRLVDGSFDDVVKFAKELPGGFDKWKVELKEFIKTIAAGTIIVRPSGETAIETWEGPHYMNTENPQMYHAFYNPEKPDISFQWQSPGVEEGSEMLKWYAIKALKFIFPHVKPKPNMSVYLEYGVKPNGSIYFIEGTDAKMLTKK